ncbi:sensor histidine kinase [Paenibacillus sp. BR2-3]|uniref:sensor histidine kinase n=1 Tax=Paenibacillus sp. BR2-3 TaxID=3048494 RepID=UPI003977BCA9
MGDSVKLAVIRCLQEALTNAKKHGNAKQIDVSLRYINGDIELIVKDNGEGASRLIPGFGVESMKDRIESVGGKFEIVSSPSEGTIVYCQVPVRGG